MPRFIKSSAVYSSDEIDCPEKRLFIAVLSQAVHDAFSAHVPPYEKNQARTWLMSNSKDFRDVCELSGRSSRYVLEKIRRKILEKQGWNVNISMRVTSPRRRRQIRKTNKTHLTGNAYYAAKRANAYKEENDRR